jgi:hypothetical protein
MYMIIGCVSDTVEQCSIKIGRNFFRKRWKLQICKIGLHLFCFYRFSAIFIYCVPLTLMIKHYRVSNYLRQYKSHVIVAIVWYTQPMIIYIVLIEHCSTVSVIINVDRSNSDLVFGSIIANWINKMLMVMIGDITVGFWNFSETT